MKLLCSALTKFLCGVILVGPVWTLLEEMGFGASLQHYNPLIDKEVKSRWHLPEEWKLIAQLPFGLPLDTPEPKKYVDASRRVIVLK